MDSQRLVSNAHNGAKTAKNAPRISPGPEAYFCANFLIKRGSSHICQSVWCSGCYSLPNDQMFHIKTLNDDLLAKDQENPEEAARLEEAWSPKYRNKLNFLEARPGDHLLVPFECDTCIFLKLRGSFPQANNTADDLLLKCIRRVNLDAF